MRRVVARRESWDRLLLLSAVVMCIGCTVLVAFARLLPDQRPQRMETESGDGAVRMNRERWIVVCWLCGLSIVFWLTAQQAGGSLCFAESHTQRSVDLFRSQHPHRTGPLRGAARSTGSALATTPNGRGCLGFAVAAKSLRCSPKMVWGMSPPPGVSLCWRLRD